MSKASILREKCCSMVLHGGFPDPVEVVDALTELDSRIPSPEGVCRALRNNGYLVPIKVLEADMKRGVE